MVGGTEFDAARGDGKPGAFDLLADAWRMVRAGGAPLVALWLASSTLVALIGWASPWSKAVFRSPLAHLGYEAVGGVANAMLTACILRLFLASAGAWRRLDQSWLKGVAILTIAGLAQGAPAAAGKLHLLGGPLQQLEFQIPVWSACAAMMLWPAAVLLDDESVTPQRSLALMKGCIGAFIGAYLLLFLAAVVGIALVALPAVLLFHVKPADVAAHVWLPAGLVFGSLAIALNAVWAALYRARTTAFPAGPLQFSARGSFAA